MSQISIIIPVYNQANEIISCLTSIQQQTFKDFEVIVVDDGSTDNLALVLAPYQTKIKLIKQINQGAPAARNAGFALSQGKYLLFCDADVVLQPTMLEKMFKILESQPELAYVYSAYKFGWKMYRGWPYSVEKLKKINVAHTTSLIRRLAFPGWDEKIKRLQDWDLWLTIMERGGQGYWLPEVLFSVKTGGTMSSWLPSFLYRFSWLPPVKRFRAAVEVIKQKHHLV
ncbi:MAG: glycosyltransferase family A protein [Candidatus Buchananbacteria bacterium]